MWSIFIVSIWARIKSHEYNAPPFKLIFNNTRTATYSDQIILNKNFNCTLLYGDVTRVLMWHTSNLVTYPFTLCWNVSFFCSLPKLTANRADLQPPPSLLRHTHTYNASINCTGRTRNFHSLPHCASRIASKTFLYTGRPPPPLGGFAVWRRIVSASESALKSTNSRMPIRSPTVKAVQWV